MKRSLSRFFAVVRRYFQKVSVTESDPTVVRAWFDRRSHPNISLIVISVTTVSIQRMSRGKPLGDPNVVYRSDIDVKMVDGVILHRQIYNKWSEQRAIEVATLEGLRAGVGYILRKRESIAA